MVSRFLLVAAAANAVLAFSDTVPVVAWSSSSSLAIDSLPTHLNGAIHSASLLGRILDAEDICTHDAIIIIEQPGLHASDLRTLSRDAHIARTIASSQLSRQYPYLQASVGIDIPSLAESVSQKCDSRLLNYAPGQSDVALAYDTKHVVHMDMPHITEIGRGRRDAMSKHDSLLGLELLALASIFPNHLVIYTGSLLRSPFSERQAPDIPDRPVLDLTSSDTAFAPINATTLPVGGILKKYQLLTPALITSLLVTFFLLLPIIFLGMNALASIQTPVRSDIGRSFNAQEKKNQ